VYLEQQALFKLRVGESRHFHTPHQYRIMPRSQKQQ
jgi:hypothetical protein